MKRILDIILKNRFLSVFFGVLLLNAVLGFLFGGLPALFNPVRWTIVIGLGFIAGYLSTRKWPPRE